MAYPYAPLKTVCATKRVVDSESEYFHVLNDHTNRWPGLCCWWCTLKIKSQPLPMVTQIRRTNDGGYQYQWRGFFCNPTCIKAYCGQSHLSFSPTRAFLSEAGVLSWSDGPVKAAPSYLTQARFGPKCAQSRQLRRSTRSLHKEESSVSCQRQQSAAAQALCGKKRKRARHCGANTLVPWLRQQEPQQKKLCDT